MAWMFARPFSDSGSSGVSLGTWVALLVPTAAAVNWSVVQHAQTRGESFDMVPAVLVGAVLSSLCTLPLAWPLQASGSDVAWLALLGLVQLAIPCVLVVICARVLPAPEISLLALLEVLFGIALAWLGANEVPSAQVLSGGSLVVLALLLNAWWTQRTTTGIKKP
jgi:drug/metabolite transporter (DMT)-like permease